MSERCAICGLSSQECREKCPICKLPLHIRKEIDLEFLEKGMSTKTVERWVKEEFNLDIQQLELFEHVKHSHLEYFLPSKSVGPRK